MSAAAFDIDEIDEPWVDPDYPDEMLDAAYRAGIVPEGQRGTDAQPTFDNEKAARQFLEDLLDPWFVFLPEVELRHPCASNKLRIDYIGKPKPTTRGFPFDIFGVEVKRANRHGGFNQATWQCASYTQSVIDDPRPALKHRLGEPLRHVYLFPAPAFDGGGWHYGVDRRAGLDRVGLIYVRQDVGGPQFRMSDERVWDPRRGGRDKPIHTRSRIGSGVVRRGEVAK